MARKMFDNLSAIVADTLTDSIKMIHIDDLHESADNFFVVERIQEFAQTILGQGGVKDNLIVRPLESGGYEIISGHRRCAAVRFLINQGANISHYLPCLIQDYDDEDSMMLDLILMNVSARQISDAELWQCYETIDHILQVKKEKGESFGRIREQIAKTLGVSPAQVGKLQNVERNAIDAVKQAVANGEISISTANEIAKLDNEQQEELAHSDLSEVKHKEVKHRQSASKTPKVDTYINDHADVDMENDSSVRHEGMTEKMFYDKAHMQAFTECIARMKCSDVYHISLAYLLTLDKICRKHLDRLFDFANDAIKIEALAQPWQTSTSQKTTRLAFNLWNGCSDDGKEYTDKDGYKVSLPSEYYSPSKIFCCSYAPYYWEAIKLRYPEYTKDARIKMNDEEM